MPVVQITMGLGGVHHKVQLTYKTDPPCIKFQVGALQTKHSGDNLFACFIKLRERLPEATFFCKGAKINVHTSRMSAQMSCGLVAYELELGRPALRSDIVNIFDYEDKSLTNDPHAQSAFFAKWLDSLKRA